MGRSDGGLILGIIPVFTLRGLTTMRDLRTAYIRTNICIRGLPECHPLDRNIWRMFQLNYLFIYCFIYYLFIYLFIYWTVVLYFQKEIKSRLKLGNACCHSAQNLLSSSLLSKNLKIKIYRTIILPYTYQITDKNTKNNGFPLYNFACCFVWV
jgi:hypothetical protein